MNGTNAMQGTHLAQFHNGDVSGPSGYCTILCIPTIIHYTIKLYLYIYTYIYIGAYICLLFMVIFMAMHGCLSIYLYYLSINLYIYVMYIRT